SFLHVLTCYNLPRICTNYHIIENNLCPRVLQLSCHVESFCPVRVVNVKLLPHVRSDPIENRACFDGDAHVRNVADFRGAVWFCEYCLAKIASDLFPVDLESGYERDVLHFVVPELGMHQTRSEVVFFRRVFSVVLNSLYQRTGAIPNACKGYFDLAHPRTFLRLWRLW